MVTGQDTLVYKDGIRNLMLRTMRVFGNATRFSHKGIQVRMKSRIPIARGLGSSATVIVGTLVGMNALSARVMRIPTISKIILKSPTHCLLFEKI